MITGHLGVAGVAGSIRRDVPLLLLFVAAVSPDIVDTAFAIARVCNPSGLYSHTLPIAALLAAAFGSAVWLATRSAFGTLAIVLVVLLHLPADMLTGHKLFWPGGEIIGWDWYERPLLDFLVETPMALAGWWLYRRNGAGEWWARSLAAGALLLCVQGAIDLYSVRHKEGIKPSACHDAVVQRKSAGTATLVNRSE